MNNKKIIFGIVLFLAICFLAFTFANPLEQGNGDGTLIQNGGNSTNTNNDDEKVVKEVVLTNPVKNKLGIGESIKLEYTVSPSTAIDKSLTYSSSDTSVVKVDQNGVVTAVGNGTATITVTSSNGKTTSVTFTVGEDTTTVADNNQNNTNGITVRPTYPVGGNTNNNNNGSSNSGNSGNNNNSGNNSGNSGNSGNNGGNTTKPEEPKVIYVSSVSISVKDSKLIVGKTTTVSSNVLPSNANDKTVTYSSSNENIATVDKEGNVTTKGTGSVNIIATSSNGKSASVEITVVGNVSSNVSAGSIDDGSNIAISSVENDGVNKTIKLSGVLNLNENGLGSSNVSVKIYVPKEYDANMLDNFYYRVANNSFGINNGGFGASHITDGYVNLVIPITDQNIESESKRIVYYFNWLGLSTEVRYIIDLNDVKSNALVNE